MPAFSSRSLAHLDECHSLLQIVAHEAIKMFDFAITDGHRGEAEQEKAYRLGYSKARWGQSPHNLAPSCAFDACPYPIDWDDLKRFNDMGKAMLEAAARVNVALTWGGNFKRFVDRPHFELTDWRTIGRTNRKRIA